jgi:hypothetical protein
VSGQPPIHVDDEARVADAMARELEAMAAATPPALPAGFADRVMAAVAREPLPQPTRAFGTALATRSLGAALAAIGDAWRVATGGRAPIAVRAQALALVLVVVAGSLAVAGGATVGAIDLLKATQPPHPSPSIPQPSQLQPTPSPSPTPSQPLTPIVPTPDGTETPEGTDGGGASERPDTATPRPTRTEDARRTPTPSPTSTEDGEGSGGDGETPSPTGTDEHSGGDG